MQNLSGLAILFLSAEALGLPHREALDWPRRVEPQQPEGDWLIFTNTKAPAASQPKRPHRLPLSSNMVRKLSQRTARGSASRAPLLACVGIRRLAR